MITEIELKYSLLKTYELASSQQIKSKICQLLTDHNLEFIHQEKQLSNHYFDTPSLSLRKHKIALRTRGTKCEGGVECFEQTIKTSGTVIAGLHQRPEYNVDIEDDKPLLTLFPDTIWQKGINVEQLQQSIIELFSTNFVRHTWLVTLDDAQVEIAFDSGEVACQGYDKKPSIYEIELEIVSGDTNLLFVLTKILFSKLALRPGQLTKAARGYALYHQSITQDYSNKNKPYKNASTARALPIIDSIEQVSQTMITLSNHNRLVDAFRQGVSFSLSQLQLSVDNYVNTHSLDSISKISELLALLRQGFWLFNESLTAEELKLRDELSYFIRTIHWVDNARYIQALKNKHSSYQKEALISQQLIKKLQLSQSRYPKESQIIELFHSERFNNLQLDLLSVLLKKDKVSDEQDSQSLIAFAANHLTENANALSNELAKNLKPAGSSSTELYITTHSLLIRALLTSSWFSCLFEDQKNNTVRKFNMPWLDIKQGISELQFLHLLEQQLEHLPDIEVKLVRWLAEKSENLIKALDQSSAKSLSMKPYWP